MNSKIWECYGESVTEYSGYADSLSALLHKVADFVHGVESTDPNAMVSVNTPYFVEGQYHVEFFVKKIAA